MEYRSVEPGNELWPVDSEAARHELIKIAGNTDLPWEIRLIAYCVHSILGAVGDI